MNQVRRRIVTEGRGWKANTVTKLELQSNLNKYTIWFWMCYEGDEGWTTSRIVLWESGLFANVPRGTRVSCFAIAWFDKHGLCSFQHGRFIALRYLHFCLSTEIPSNILSELLYTFKHGSRQSNYWNFYSARSVFHIVNRITVYRGSVNAAVAY